MARVSSNHRLQKTVGKHNHIGGHNEYILTGQLVGFANYFVCSLQHLFFVVFYIVGQSDCLSPDAFLKLLDNYVFQKQ